MSYSPYFAPSSVAMVSRREIRTHSKYWLVKFNRPYVDRSYLMLLLLLVLVVCVWRRRWALYQHRPKGQPTNQQRAQAHLSRQTGPCPLSSRVPSSSSLWCRRPGYLSSLRTHPHPTSPIAACGRVQPGCEGSRCVGAVAERGGSWCGVSGARAPKKQASTTPTPPSKTYRHRPLSSHLLAG